jgi:hypothetical protein
MENYYNRIMHTGKSFLAITFGLFKLINLNVYFIIMENIIQSNNPLKVFDIKGS